jgi:hypothetical protein
MPLSKEPSKLTADELAQEMWKHSDSVDHLQARAELERRRSRYMLASAIGTSISAIAAAQFRDLRPERRDRGVSFGALALAFKHDGLREGVHLLLGEWRLRLGRCIVLVDQVRRIL